MPAPQSLLELTPRLSSSFEGSVSSNLSGVSAPVQKERSMTFWDWPLDDAILEIKADEDWMSQFGEIEVLHNGGEGGMREYVELTSEFQEVDFTAIRPLVLPKDGFPHSPYHTCAYIILRLGRDGSELPVVSHLVDSRPSRGLLSERYPIWKIRMGGHISSGEASTSKSNHQIRSSSSRKGDCGRVSDISTRRYLIR